ncbi:MAG: hypothetical protein QNJ17_15770 [Desulfocapsaceae bacterium]|nr:hypothetical protein [Desulfocapsaceae bacterium]
MITRNLKDDVCFSAAPVELKTRRPWSMHSQIFQVKDNRVRFKCPACGTKRVMPVPPGTRHKTIRCHRCETKTRCLLNRREQLRQQQTGKAVMILPGGKEIPIDLHDISSDGIGCIVARDEHAPLATTEEVHFSCDWSQALFHHDRYIIRNIRGTRIGAEKAD